jgi:hypothetical protein
MISRKRWEDMAPQQKIAIGVLGMVQLLLLAAALLDLRRRTPEQIRGSKSMWTLLAFVNYVGPISYFLIGRKREGED